MRSTVSGAGYVGLSNAILLSQNSNVIAFDIDTDRVDLINSRESPVRDTKIDDYLATKKLHLRATTNH